MTPDGTAPGQASTSRRLWVVIPVHDRVAHTLRCLDALAGQQAPLPVTVVVVDDGSTDGTADAVRRQHPEAVLLRGDGDLWWTGATNRGVAWVLAQAGDDDLVLTLNNDTVPPPGYLATLVGHAAARPRALIGSLAVGLDDPDRIVDGGVTVDWRTAKYEVRGRGRRLSEAAAAPPLRPASVLSGRGTLVPVRAYREIGLYSPLLPQYGADYEFARRAARHGWELLVAWDAPLPSDTAATGLHDACRHLGVRDTLRSLWSRRSPNSLPYRWRYARLCVAPRDLPRYVLCDTLRVLGGRLRALLSGGRARRPAAPPSAGSGR